MNKMLGITEDYNEWKKDVENKTFTFPSKVITDLDIIKSFKYFMLSPVVQFGDVVFEASLRHVEVDDQALVATLQEFEILYMVLLREPIQATDEDGNLIDEWSDAKYCIRGVTKDRFEEAVIANKIISKSNNDANCTSINNSLEDENNKAKVLEILKVLQKVSLVKLLNFGCTDDFRPIKEIMFNDFNNNLCYAYFVLENVTDDIALGRMTKITSEKDLKDCMSLLTFFQWQDLVNRKEN